MWSIYTQNDDYRGAIVLKLRLTRQNVLDVACQYRQHFLFWLSYTTHEAETSEMCQEQQTAVPPCV
jgi:hypothetical protein